MRLPIFTTASLLLALFATALPLGCATGEKELPPASTIEPIHLMSGVVFQHHRQLMAALAEDAPSATTWHAAATHAAVLAESGEILLRHIGNDQGPWQVAASTLQRGSLATLAGIEHHDLAEARTGFEGLNTACSTCHRECGAGDAPPWKR